MMAPTPELAAAGGTMKRGREEIGAGAGVGGDPATNDGGRKYNKSGPGKPSWLEPVEEGQKRARRPPPRFESLTTVQEEMIIRQAIENSKIETKLSTDSVASIPEVPTYWPTPEEFREPLQYIESIRAEGERYGIVKIVPPAGWDPPAAALDQTVGKGEPFATRRQSLKYFQEGTGFGDGRRYTFGAYEAMADAFRERWVEERYRQQGRADPSWEDLERDYWRIIEAQEEEVDVEYGNDLDTMTYGSGFPRPPGLLQGEGDAAVFDVETVGAPGKGRELGDADYHARCGWNLSNLPLWPGSVLRSVRIPMKGVNVPWLYMGMLFATFCWHNEDNFMYSLNYLHRGAPKQWYTVPGASADAMEKVMRNFLRETFQKVPDLLHHMTTHFSPMLFQRAGVPVFKTVQEPGQFIVTFPKSLHAGFSHGFNCAEAVNFSPPAWLPFGREAVERYRRFGRNPVFSHDRLVLTLASNLSADWSEASIRALLADLTAIVKEEEALRRELRAKGVRFGIVGKDKLPANQLAYMDDQSLDYDEKRACLSCRHVCFLSAVACECDALQVACLREAARLCGCRMERRFLLAWHDMDELWEFVEKVRRFLEEHPRRRAVGGGGHKDPAHPHEESKETKVEGPGLVVKEEAAAAPAE